MLAKWGLLKCCHGWRLRADPRSEPSRLQVKCRRLFDSAWHSQSIGWGHLNRSASKQRLLSPIISSILGNRFHVLAEFRRLEAECFAEVKWHRVAVGLTAQLQFQSKPTPEMSKTLHAQMRSESEWATDGLSRRLGSSLIVTLKTQASKVSLRTRDLIWLPPNLKLSFRECVQQWASRVF